MNIKAKLAQLRKSEARNTQRLKAWKDARRRKQATKTAKKERGP